MKSRSKHFCAWTALLTSSLAAAWAQTTNTGPLLIIPEAKAHRIVLINPTSKSIVGSIHVQGWPHEIAFSNDGRTAYIPSYSDAIVGHPGIDGQTIDVVNMQTNSLITWDLGKPLRPHKPMLLDDANLLVSTELANALSIIDTKSGKITAQIPTGAAQSHVFLKTADSKKIYKDEAFIACYLSGNLDILNLATWTLELSIPAVAHGDGITLWPGLK
jgi:DNA-binding beta-propeller fold protein YncE